MAASIALHAVVVPSLNAVEASDPSASAILNSLKVALEKAEEANPGIVHEFIDKVLEAEQSKGGEESVERLLRVASNDIADYSYPEKTNDLKNLRTKSSELKKILSTIPELISDRTKFLGLIREIAGKIKQVLEAMTTVFQQDKALLQKNLQALEQHKKAFVRVSKSFSETLKRFFKDGKKDAVLRSAHRLINQTNLVLRTVKLSLE